MNIKTLLHVLASPAEWLVVSFPGPVGTRLRYYYWRARMKHVGKRVTFGVGIQITNPKYISIGENSWIDDQVILIAGPPGEGGRKVLRKLNPYFHGTEGEISIGANCHIAQQVVIQGHGGFSLGASSGVASGCRIYTLSHTHRESSAGTPEVLYKFSPRVPPHEQSLVCSPCVMEYASGIGLNSVMLPGATIREGAWVGLLSFVAGEIPPYTVAAGNPAQAVRARVLPADPERLQEPAGPGCHSDS